jgi:hypothetical protein
MAPTFAPNCWGRLSQFEIPHSIVQDEMLILKLGVRLGAADVCFDVLVRKQEE